MKRFFLSARQSWLKHVCAMFGHRRPLLPFFCPRCGEALPLDPLVTDALTKQLLSQQSIWREMMTAALGVPPSSFVVPVQSRPSSSGRTRGSQPRNAGSTPAGRSTFTFTREWHDGDQ